MILWLFKFFADGQIFDFYKITMEFYHNWFKNAISSFDEWRYSSSQGSEDKILVLLRRQTHSMS
jgi:hypothetical protein